MFDLFDSVNAIVVQGERFMQSGCPGKIVFGGAPFPAIISELEFGERLELGGFPQLTNCHCRLLREDLPDGITFQRGQQVTVHLLLQDHTERIVTLQVGDANAEAATGITLELEALR